MDGKLGFMIERFGIGNDTSIESANEIEFALDEEYPEDDFLQQTAEMLAMYRPQDGDFLFDTEAIHKRLTETAAYLAKCV